MCRGRSGNHALETSRRRRTRTATPIPIPARQPRTGVMVASVAALTSSAQASSYYEADDYYADGGLSPSEWQGKGAETLDLSGEVDRDRFRALLDGKVAGEQLGTMRDGQLEHRPGWDVTLSAPKSVSIMAEVAGDRRLIAAHGEAVRTAMAHRSEEHTSELQSLMRISYAVFCLKKK